MQNAPNTPLAERRRPKHINEYVGQTHLLGERGLLRPMLESGLLPSLILWGPPGVGKTTLARLLAESTGHHFQMLSAVHAGVKDVREAIVKAEERHLFSKGKPLLFIDEIHRFNKSQQDSLLAAVEKGSLTLIGATTENPGFEVIPALLSRCQVFVLEALKPEELETIGRNALSLDSFFAPFQIELPDWKPLLRIADGDARRLLNLLEMLVQNTSNGQWTWSEDRLEELLKSNPILYDKKGEQHYDLISAFIKSVRGSDPNAALYWMARMIEGGEDPKFIARRMLILAAEDIGLANPNALLLANACFEAVNVLGMPEARIPLGQCAIYLAISVKSNSAYLAIDQAIHKVKETGKLEVPLHLRNAANSLLKKLDYGKNYQYAHDFDSHFINQEYLPEAIKGSTFYSPADNPAEHKYQEWLKRLWREKYGY